MSKRNTRAIWLLLVLPLLFPVTVQAGHVTLNYDGRVDFVGIDNGGMFTGTQVDDGFWGWFRYGLNDDDAIISPSSGGDDGTDYEFFNFPYGSFLRNSDYLNPLARVGNYVKGGVGDNLPLSNDDRTLLETLSGESLAHVTEYDSWDWHYESKDDPAQAGVGGNLQFGIVVAAWNNLNWLTSEDYRTTSPGWDDVDLMFFWISEEDASGTDLFFAAGTLSRYRVSSTTKSCDFDDDGDCDIDDLDTLSLLGDLSNGVAVSPANAKFDLDGNDRIDDRDMEKWRIDAAWENGFTSRYTIGDIDLDRDVDITDFNTLATHFDPGGSNPNNKFSWGDTEGNGRIDITDFGQIATNFDAGGYDAPTATAAAAEPGQVDLVVDLATGEVTLDGNAAAISGLQIFSSGNSLLVADFTADVLQFVISTNTSTYAEGAFVNMPVNGVVSLGTLYDLLVDARDLTFEYTMIGQPTVSGTVAYIPEPASLAFLGMAGLLALRRRTA